MKKLDPWSFNRRRMLITVGSLLFAAAAGAGGVAFGYQQGKAGSDEYYKPQNAALVSQLASLQADKAKSSADAAAIPNLAAIANKYAMSPTDAQPTSLAVTFMDGDPQSKVK